MKRDPEHHQGRGRLRINDAEIIEVRYELDEQVENRAQAADRDDPDASDFAGRLIHVAESSGWHPLR